MLIQFENRIPFPFVSALPSFHIRAALLDAFQSVDKNIPSFSNNEKVYLLFYRSPRFNCNQSNKILGSSITFIVKSGRLFDLISFFIIYFAFFAILTTFWLMKQFVSFSQCVVIFLCIFFNFHTLCSLLVCIM